MPTTFRGGTVPLSLWNLTQNVVGSLPHCTSVCQVLSNSVQFSRRYIQFHYKIGVKPVGVGSTTLLLILCMLCVNW